MKRTVAAAFVFLFIATTLSAAELHSYIVATKLPMGGPGAVKAQFRDVDPTFAPTDITVFQSVNGFAATMTDDEAAALKKSAAVRYVEPDAERHILSIRNVDGQTVPYGIDLIHSRDAWVAGKGAAINVVIGDTGIDYNHPELKAAYAGGYNTITKTNDPLDDHGHGTHVAGTIAAADNTIGVVGIAPNVRLWSVKVLNSDGAGTVQSMIAMVDWILAKKTEVGGNWVLNLSLGSSTPSNLEREAFAKLINAGIVVCAASGNDSTATVPAPVGYPAGYAGVLAVGAVDSSSKLAEFSNQGPELALTAPGVAVLSCARIGTGSLTYVKNNTTFIDSAALSGSKTGTVTGQYVYCNFGGPGDFPASVAGKIALIQRGNDIRFADKAKRAKEAGAIGVVVFNNGTDTYTNWALLTPTPNDPTDPYLWTLTYDWPVTVGMSRQDGQALQQQNGGTITIANVADDYTTLSGTSMATPHVTGAAALVWSIAPNATPDQLKTALEQTADDRGPHGQDPAYGYGIVDALAAAKQLNPAAFGSPVTPPSSKPTTGRTILRRGPKP